MALPQDRRDEIEALAREWVALNARSRRVERLNQLASVLILVCGGVLLAFSDYISSKAELVLPLTGGFLWGGWYKMYIVGNRRREARLAAEKIEQDLKELCGPDAEFPGIGPEIALGGTAHDPFRDADYA